MKKSIFIVFSLFLAIPLFCLQRPPNWAQPVELNGVSNFFKVTDNIYRSAQPTKKGFEELKKFGIKTVIDLRFFHNDKNLIKTSGLNRISIYMLPTYPQEEEVITFLTIISDSNNGPFLIHCQHGSDRTGTMIAIYRIIIQGWTKDQAIDEMIHGGYGFHPVFENLPAFIKELNIDKIKLQAGIK